MREIKFRAWDLNEDELVPWEYLIGRRYNQDFFGKIQDGVAALSVLTDQGLILEQFTGLKDKNGREIYEGDILCSERNNNPPAVCLVEFCQERGQWALTGYGGRTESGRSTNQYDFFPFGFSRSNPWQTHRMEVIGNIHENSELLK